MKNPIAIIFVLMAITITTYAGPQMKVVKFSINPFDWVHQAPDVSALSFNYEDKDLTKDIFDKGTVLVYVLGTSGGGWWPMPHSYPNGEGTVSYNYLPGHVEIRLYGNWPDITYNYKMVIISGRK